MPIESNIDSEQANVGKMLIKEVTMATSSGNLLTEFLVENKYTYWTHSPTMNREASGREQTKGQATRLGNAKPQGQKLHRKGTTMHACNNHPLANSRSPS